MNTIPTILNKELLKEGDKLNIIWTPCDNQNFTKFIQNLGHNLYNYEHLYFGNIIPHIIICNNKMYSHQQVKNISINYHLPVLLVDHTPKDNTVDLEMAQETINNFKCSYKIAINKKVYDSWGATHDQILSYNNDSSILEWQKLLYSTSQKVFTL